jgi:hypothetical protein
MTRPSWQLRDAALGYASRGIPVLPPHYPPTMAASSRFLVTPSLRSGPTARVGIRAAASLPSIPWVAWCPTGQGRHHQSGPDPGLVDPPPPGQHRPGHRAPLRRPGRRRPRRRPGIRELATTQGLPELGAAGPHRRGWLALLPGPDRPRQRLPGRLSACGLAGPRRLCGRPTQPPRLRPPLPVDPRARPRHPTRPGARGAARAAPAPPTPPTNHSGPAPSRRSRRR